LLENQPYARCRLPNRHRRDERKPIAEAVLQLTGKLAGLVGGGSQSIILTCWLLFLSVFSQPSACARQIVLPDVSAHYENAEGDPRLLPANAELPVSGYAPDSSQFKKLDKAFLDLMHEYDIPGASLAIAIKGKIIVARGYGYADLEKKIKVEPDSLFRIASISKSLTAVAVARLFEEHQQLNDKTPAFSVLKYPWPNHSRRDPRLSDITIADLLQCTAGWNRDLSGDPLFTPHINEAAEHFTPTLRPNPDSVIRNWLTHDLDFTPGTHFSYSNLCYAILGRIIQVVSGMSYEDYVQSEILKPLGITDMRLAKTCELAPKEVVHYPFAGQETGSSLFPNFKGDVPLNYGANFSLEAMCADTGWLATAVDLVKFAGGVFGDNGIAAPISSSSLKQLLEKPEVPEWHDSKSFFARGFQVEPARKDHRLQCEYREGCLPGSQAVMMHRDDGVSWCFLLNSRPYYFSDCQLKLAKAIWACLNEKKPAR
jgi:N-acyl-D-amino-acid deacylase